MAKTIADNLASLKKRIADYKSHYQRQDKIILLAASKKQSLEKMQQAIAAGQFIFGENYLQEALPKMQALQNHALEWHFIGPLQSNKTKKIAENFSWVHTLNSEKNAKRLNDQRPPQLPPLNICIEVNISGESTKSGIKPDQVQALAQSCANLPNLRLRGLMAIPEPHSSLPTQRAELSKLRSIFLDLNNKGYNLDILSMGMSDDLEAAIAEGATLVRIGTALFGPRV